MLAGNQDPLGCQVVARFPAGGAPNASRVIYDAMSHEWLTHIMCTGHNVRITVEWGTSKGVQISRLQCPLRFDVTGNCTIIAEHDDETLDGAASVAVKPSTCAGPPYAAGIEIGPTALQVSAIKVQAIDACTLTVEGVAVALAAGAETQVRGRTVLVTGTALITYLL